MGRGAVQQHLDKHHQAGAQLERVQACLVAQDVTVPGQPLHPRQHGGGRQGDVFGQFEIGDAAILLQTSQDVEVDAIQVGRGFTHDRR